MQGISSNLLAVGRKFSSFVPRASSTLRNFPTFLALDFSQLSDALTKRLKFHINVRQGLKKVLNGLLDLSFYWVIISSIFRSSNTSDVIIIFDLGCDYYIWNRLEALKTALLLFQKNETYTNWFGSFDFHIYLKWDNLRHYEWIFKTHKVEWHVYSTEIRIHFHFQSERDNPCAYALLSV